MNWTEIQALYDGQGLVFWAAVAAVALGLTLLCVSIVFQLKKMMVKARSGRRNRRGRQPAAVTAKVAAATAEGYKPGILTPAAKPAAAVESPDPMLTALLARLRTSGDRLERMHLSLGRQEGAFGSAVPESSLKQPVDQVDYVYQAARA